MIAVHFNSSNLPTKYIFFLTLFLTQLVICDLFPVQFEVNAQTTKQNSVDTIDAAGYFEKALSFSKAAKFDSSNFYFNKAKHIYIEISKNENTDSVWLRLVQCHNNVGNNLWKLGKYDEAMTNLNTALEIGLAKIGKNHPEMANCYNRMGIVHTIQGQYGQALEFYEKALEVSAEEYPEIAAKNYNNIGIVYVEKGEYDKALENYEKSLSIRITVLGEEHPDVGDVYNNIGNVYWYKSDYDKALEHYLKDLSIRVNRNGEESLDVAMSYHNIGMVHSQKGDYNRALEYWQKALSIRRQSLGEQHRLVASTYFNMARCYWVQEDYESALGFGKKSLAIRLAAFGENHPDIAQCYNHLANVHYKLGEADLSLDYLDKALAIRLDILGNFHPDVAQIYYDIAQVKESQGALDPALMYCQKAMISLVSGFKDESAYSNPRLQRISDERNLLNVLSLKAGIFATLAEKKNRNKLQMALSTYRVAADLIDKMRTGYKAEGSKLFLGETVSEVYDEGIRTSLELHSLTQKEDYKQQAFFFAEKSKAAVLQEGLAEAQARQFAKLPADLLQKEEQLRLDLTFYETRLQKESLKKAGFDSVKAREYESRLFNLNAHYEQLIADFEKNYPAYYDLKYQTESAAVVEIQARLAPNTALLEYFVGDETIYIFFVSRDEFDIIAVDRDSHFPQQVDDFYQAVVKAETKQYLSAAGDLSNLLIKPVVSKIAGKTNLLIIPHDMLYKLPFEALLTRLPSTSGRIDFSNLDYLIKQFAISYHYSATLLAHSLQKKHELAAGAKGHRNSFVGFAPVFPEQDETGYTVASKDLAILSAGPDDWLRSVVADGRKFNELKYSEHEVKSIIRLFAESADDEKSIGFFQADATEDAFKVHVKDYRTVHVATHSFINETRPQISGVLFAQPIHGPAAEDGVLYAGETYNLDLKAGLLVLSSCESGLGKLVRGEGMMALTRGFLYSGAENILFSLWKVPDKHTSELMIEFYRQMISGKSYAESLRQTKLKAIANAATARPRSWAGFVLVGGN